ncbi:MAG: NAD-dependent epimerase/dehydratase family protein [Betaproteobacteria bacterium]|nr:MAG: NAD-dependent epimerase/dehydratase family protein [Betaproteobacteria bacterium]
MNILIIGAARGVGRHLAEQALAHGHHVTGLVLDPLGAGFSRRNLRLVGGDIVNCAAVAEAVKGQDAICITIGIRPTRAPVDVFSRGTEVTLAEMRHAGVRRLVCVTGIGAGDSRGHGGWLYDRIIQPLLLKSIYADKDRQETLVRASVVNWTIVRPGFLTNWPGTGRYRISADLTGVTARKISRADVASYLLREMTTSMDAGRTVLVDAETEALISADRDLRQTAGASLE